MNRYDYLSVLVLCSLLLVGVGGTRSIYHDAVSGYLKRMKLSCQVLAGLMIAATLLAFSLGVRWHHVYADALHRADVRRHIEPAQEMYASHPEKLANPIDGRPRNVADITIEKDGMSILWNRKPTHYGLATFVNGKEF